MRKIGSAPHEALDVAGLGRRHHQHASTVVVRPPAEVEVVAVEVDVFVESAEGPEQIGTHEQTRRGQGEDVAYGVVLFLVGLPGLDDGIHLGEPVDAEPDVLQDRGVVPLDQLRAHDAGVRPVHLLDEQPDRVGLEGDVVVQEAEEPVVALDEAQHLVRRGPEARIAVDGTHERSRHGGRDLPRKLTRVAGDQHQRLEVAVVLGRQRTEHLGEPWPRVVDHHDGHHGRCDRAGGVHEETRLAVWPCCDRSAAQCLQELALCGTLFATGRALRSPLT